MIISLIVAMNTQGGIGLDGGLPWHLSSDLKRFKKITMGHHLVMGRKTYESIGRPLPGREMIILTRQENFQIEGCQTTQTMAAALDIARNNGDNEVFIIGGGEVFRQALPVADRIYLTEVQAKTKADTYFPPLNYDEWNQIESTLVTGESREDFDYIFKILERKDRRAL